MESCALVLEPGQTVLLNEKMCIIVDSCLRWFNRHAERRSSFLRILERRERFSLRLVDWFVTNYSKDYRVTIRSRLTDVHSDYHRHMIMYTKRFFDPFARRDRIRLVYKGDVFVTTTGQLNFFRWFLERNLDHVVVQSRVDIDRHMKRMTVFPREPSPPVKGDDVMCVAANTAEERVVPCSYRLVF